MRHLDLIGERVYFKRQGLQQLRGYWAHRGDSPTIREAVTRRFTPRYWVDGLALDGLFLRLRRIDLLWYRGLFSVGRHLRSGRYIQAPIPHRLRGLGPRQLVFPMQLLERLDGLELIGGWRRYALSAGLDAAAEPTWRADERDRVTLSVHAFSMARPPGLVQGFGRWRSVSARLFETVCVTGIALNTPLAGLRLVVPIGEVFWNQFHVEGAAWW